MLKKANEIIKPINSMQTANKVKEAMYHEICTLKQFKNRIKKTKGE